MSTTPIEPEELSPEDQLVLFVEEANTSGLSELSVWALLDLTAKVIRKNTVLESLAQTDNDQITELEVEKLGLQIELYNLRG